MLLSDEPYVPGAALFGFKPGPAIAAGDVALHVVAPVALNCPVFFGRRRDIPDLPPSNETATLPAHASPEPRICDRFAGTN